MNKLFLCLILIGVISAETITTSDLASALSSANPGDIIEVKAGIYNSVSFSLKSGTKGKPITIRAAKNAKVIFTGTSSRCIFDDYGHQYVNIEGPFELKNAFCGAKIMGGSNINISGLTVHDTQQHGIVVSGNNNNVFDNTVYNCVMENKATATTKEYGWSQCVAVWGTGGGNLSKNIHFKNNVIYNGYGEGLDFLECDTCSAIGNKITNGFSMNIYIDVSRNILIEGNTLRVTSDAYNTKWGRACGVGLAPESGQILLENITIKNNVMIGTRMGVYFFTMGKSGGYDKVKILHNTLWKVSVTPVWFQSPGNTPSGCEMRNNFFYYETAIDFEPASSWTIANNYYYNTYNLPSKYPGSNQKSAQTLELSSIFQNKGNCNYYDMSLDAECLRPSKSPGWLDLYHGGSKPINEVSTDFAGCTRNANKPSVGAFEYPEGCGGDVTPDSSDEPTSDSTSPDGYDIKFKINYCTSGSQIVKVVGSHCSWNVGTCTSMSNTGSCNWEATISNASEKTFSYKFVIANGSSAYRWESDPNRTFNGPALVSQANKASTGTYEKCSYVKSGTTITLICVWR